MKTKRVVPLILALLTFVFLGISGGLLNIAWTYIQPTFGVPLDALAVLLMVGTAGSLTAAFTNGALIGRFGLARVVIIGSVLATAGLFGYAIVPTWGLLLVIEVVLFVGRGTLDAGMNNFVSAHYSAAEMNWLHAAWGLGLTIAPAIITFIILNLEMSWRVSYGFVGVLMLLLTVGFFLTMRAWTLDADDTESTSGPVRNATMKETISRPVVIGSVLLLFAYGGVEIGTGQLANTLLVSSRNFPQETASLWIGLYWGSFTVGRMLVGLMALRLNDHAILLGSMILQAAGTVILAFFKVPVLNLTGMMMIGLGAAAIFPVLISQMPLRVGREHAANAIGFGVGFGGLGGAVLPGVASWLAEHFGLETIGYFLLVNAIIVLVIYIALTMVPHRQPQPASS